MPQNTSFPAFLQLNYDENGVNARFESDIRSMTQSAEQKFKASANEIDRVLDQALSRPRNQSGSLDLGVPELKAAAAAAEARAAAAREVANATNLAARAEGDYSQQARMAVAATSAKAREELEAAQAARSHAAAAEQVQLQLNKTKSATDALVMSQRAGAMAGGGLTNSLGSQRFAMIQVGQQLQDVQVGLLSGQRATTVFAQQLPQLGFALSGFSGKIGALGTFLAGPWGVAVFAATTALGLLVAELWKSEEAAKAAELASNGLSDAQSVLGNVFDLTSGKIKSQNELLIVNARLQAINLRSEALAAAAKFNTTAGRSGDTNFTDLFMANLKGGGGSKGSEEMQRLMASQGDVKRLFDDLRAGRLKPETALGLSETIDLTGSKLSRTDIQEAVVSFLEKDAKEAVAAQIDKSLDDGILASGFRKPASERKGRQNKDAEREAKAAVREADRLSALSDQAAESVLRINEQFDDQPRLVDRSAQAVRKLQGLMGDINDPKNIKNGKNLVPGAERIKKDIDAAIELASSAVDNEIGRYAQVNEKNLEIMSLQSLGLFDQAEILQEINRLDERLGLSSRLDKLTEEKTLAQLILEDETATTDEREKALGIVEKTTAEIAKIGDQQANITQEVQATHEASKGYNMEIRRARQELNDQLSVLDEIENSLTGLLGGKVSGKEFFQDLRGAFNELQAKTSFRSIFGDAFDQIEAELNRDSPLSKANERLVGQVDQTGEVVNAHNQALADAGNAVIKFADVVNRAALPAGSAPVANDNQREIVVTAIRDEMELKNNSVIGLANEIGLAVTEPFARILGEVFGTQFGQMLSGVLASAVGGYSVGGATGGILGGLRGAAFEFGPDIFGKGLNDKILKGLDGAIAGAGTGTQMAGIAKALGLGGNFSSTGSQIGGAIGSVIPIPGGDIIGSVIGGFLGGLFKKKPKGVSVISGIDGPAAVSGNKGSVRDNLTQLSGGLQESLATIAEQFGAEVGAFRVSIGQRKDYFRVSASGSREVDAKKYPRNAGSDLLYDGKDAEEAARIALLNAIQDGAILGIRQGSQRLLQAGKDIEKSVREALDFESVFKRLQQYKDPVGAALDTLDKEFKRLVGIFGKAGASTQEYADLEELYGIERAQAVKEASERITGSLRDLFEELTIGDSGLSLRSRLGSAQSAYDPLAQRVADGDITAYDDYADAARNLLELQREVYGSSEDYFKLLEEVTNLTKTRIDEESNIASIAVDRDTPFTVDQTPVVNALNYQTDLLASYLAAIAKNGASGGVIPSFGGGGGSVFNQYVVNF